MVESQALPARRGLYFEEFFNGLSVTSQGRTVTEADVVAYAGLTGDWNPLHTDAVYAASHPLGRRVAHGFLGLSIASGLAMRLGFLEGTTLAFREVGNWKLSLPIYLGDTVHVRAVVSETQRVARLKAGLVSFQVELVNQDGKVVQHGTWRVLVMCKES